MPDLNYNRRDFLKLGGAGLTGAFLNLRLAPAVAAPRNREFRLNKPEWVIYRDGSYDLISEEITIKNCRPAIEGEAVMPVNVFLGDSPKGKRIVYELRNGFVMLDLKVNNDSISIGSEMSGFSRAPHFFYPLSQGRVRGVDRFMRHGLGYGGPSRIFNINELDIPLSGNQMTARRPWSVDSYLATAIMGKNTTIAIGLYEHFDYIHRSTFYNRTHRDGLNDRNLSESALFFESGFSMERVYLQDEYTKLPDIYLIGGNDTYNTLERLAYNAAETSQARQGSATSYHWCTVPTKEAAFGLDQLQKQLEFLKTSKPATPVQTLLVDEGYCTIGDWLEPYDNWPGGLDRAAREIFQYGYKAGIWVAPFVVSENSKVFRRNPEWLVRDLQGNLIPVQEHKGEVLYALDGTHPEFVKHITRVFKTMRRVGFIFYKIDFLAAGIFDSLKVNRAVPGKSSVQVYRDICQIIRDEIGDGSFWLASRAPYGPSVGYADAMQLSDDQNCNWNEEGITKMLNESWLCQYLNNILWQNDPGAICFDDTRCPLDEDEKISVALWKSFLGGVVSTSDCLLKMPPRFMDMFRFLEPSKRPRNATMPVWPDHDEIKVAVRYYRPQRAWGVLVLNTTENQVTRTLSVSDLTDRDKAWVFSWWPRPVIPYGELSNLTVMLNPRQSRLFFLAAGNNPPPNELTLGGNITGEPNI